MSLYANIIDLWKAFGELVTGPSSGTKFNKPVDFLTNWRANLEDRVAYAADRLSEHDGVTGLILAGGIGKGDPWPLSDVDIVAVYRSVNVDGTQRDVSVIRTEVEREWLDEGFPTALDIRSICFTEEEVSDALKEAPSAILRRFDQVHWYHGVDKTANGRVVYDQFGATNEFLDWMTDARSIPEIISERKARCRCPGPEDWSAARAAVETGSLLQANLALRTLVQSLVFYLKKGVWDDSGKLGRNCTRFERLASENGVGKLGRSLMHLLEPVPVEEKRWKSAPDYVGARHLISYPSRQAAGEDVSASQDQRDVIDFFTNIEMPHGEKPFPAWTGTQKARNRLSDDLAQLDELAASYSILWECLRSV